jgi:hypothetical protein
VVKRYRMVSPDSYNRLIMSKPSITIPPLAQRSRSSSPEISTWKDILIMLPVQYRRNTRMIMSYLGQLPNHVFRIIPGSMEISIDNCVISGSNFIELLHAIHNNLLKVHPIGLLQLLYLMALGTSLPAFTVQNSKLRNVFESMRK